MKRTCQKCMQHIAAEESIVICKGFCEEVQRYHTHCVGLAEGDRDTCNLRNVFWMCDECCGLMSNSKFRNTINGWRSADRKVDCEVEALRNEVIELKESVTNFMDSLQITKSSSALSSPQPSPSRQGSIKDDMKPLSSTKIINSPSCSMNNTKVNETCTKFKLHLSNIAVDVTESEVAEMVSDVLGVDKSPIVKCLIPSWKDTSSLDFLSFKVEVDSCSRTRALNPSYWPEGVRCREFKEFIREAWRPRTKTR